MRITSLSHRLAKRLFRTVRRCGQPLAAAVVTGGLMFSGGAAQGANVLADSSFDSPGPFPLTQTDAWGEYRAYAQTYGGVAGPDLPDVGTLNYGFNDDIPLAPGDSFHGLNLDELSSQTVSLVNPDLTAGQISAGEGRFEFSGWMQTCCGDEPALELVFDDAALTTVILDRTETLNQVTTADKLVNPGGPDNTTSETSIGFWALYEVQGVIPTDATMATVTIRLAPGESGGGNFDLGADLVILDAVRSTEVLFDPTLKMTIDRDSGAVTLINNTGVAQDIKGYSLLSSAGTLSEAEATFMADTDSDWVQLTTPGDFTDLSEGHLTTGTLAQGTEFELGNAWTKYFDEDGDLTFQFLDGTNVLQSGIVEYTGTTQVLPFQQGDLDFDGDVDGLDWLAYVANLGIEFSGLNDSQAYAVGDFNNDGVNSHSDFLAFQGFYNAVNGPGALQALISGGVPEPASFVLFALAGVAATGLRGKKSQILND